MDRRSFLRIAGAAALAWSADLSALAKERSRVVRVTAQSAKEWITPEAARNMVARALMSLTGEESEEESWRALFHPEDVVGIKVNCLAGRGISTSPEIVQAIAEGLKRIGIERNRIIVWDRNDRDLTISGFKPGDEHPLYRCFGTDRVGFDEKLYEKGSVGSLVSRILTAMCTAIINIPVLKDHGIAGVSIALKNYFGAIHNPNKYHPDGGNPYIADLNSMDIIRKKERLIVCDCSRIQYHGGPAYDPRWNTFDGSLLVSRDPVALDSLGLEMIEAIRREKGLPSLEEENRYPRYIATAAAIGVGKRDHDEVEFMQETI